VAGAYRLFILHVQIRAMHASLQTELEKGEKAYKRIKDQVSESSSLPFRCLSLSAVAAFPMGESVGLSSH
jgi:hypothetical protein